MKIILFFLLLSSCAPELPYKVSDHFDGKKFHNIPPTPNKGFMNIVKWRLFGKRGKWKEDVKAPKYRPRTEPIKNVRVTFINHASFLLEFKNLTILTDPIWSERASPFGFAGPKRAYVPSVKIDDIKNVDLVIISHNHYDHLDIDSLKILNEKFAPQFLVPLGDKQLLEKHGISKVMEMDWGDRFEMKEAIINFAPSQHWSARSLFDKNQSLWGSYIIQDKTFKLYFAGDTGYGPHFKTIYEQFGPMEVSLLPIGAYEPRDIMKNNHMSPSEAVMAHQDLKSVFSVGMHFGTFQLTDEDQTAPAKHLKLSLVFQGQDKESFKAPHSGQIFDL